MTITTLQVNREIFTIFFHTNRGYQEAYSSRQRVKDSLENRLTNLFCTIFMTRVLFHGSNPDTDTVNYQIYLRNVTGPLTGEKFLEMLNYRDDLSQEEWSEHIDKYTTDQLQRVVVQIFQNPPAPTPSLEECLK